MNAKISITAFSVFYATVVLFLVTRIAVLLVVVLILLTIPPCYSLDLEKRFAIYHYPFIEKKLTMTSTTSFSLISYEGLLYLSSNVLQIKLSHKGSIKTPTN